MCLALLGLGCAGTGESRSRAIDWSDTTSGPLLGDEATIAFVDSTRASGLAGVSYPADLGKAKIIATMGGGVAWGDYDADGDPDLYVTQGIASYRPGQTATTCGRLFRNDGSTGFVEVSEPSRLAACGWGSGAVFEDIDLDGDLDLFLTFVGENQLWINGGDGTFADVATAWGLAAPGYNSGAAFLDYDRDGDLDLYVTRYVDTTIEAELEWRALELRMPEEYPAPDNALFRNDGHGAWVDVTIEAGAADGRGRSLAVVGADFDLDGWCDLFVANDRSPNALLHNQGDGTFEDVTALAGVGVGTDGHWESAMGIAVADVDDNGYQDILVTNYVDEPNTLFVNLGELVFADETRSRGLYQPALPWVAWGAELVDFDNDGSLDLYVANGHILPNWISRVGYWFRRDELIHAYTRGGYRQPVLLFHGKDGGFELVDTGEDGLVGRRIAARGSATADVDTDGRLDLFVMSLPDGSPSALLLNRTPSSGGWLALELRGRGPGDSALGTRVHVESTAGSRHLQLLSGGSYLSSSAVPLHVGLAEATEADLELIWPSGAVTRYQHLKGDRRYVLR